MDMPLQFSGRGNFVVLAQLAEFFVRPLELVHDDHLALPNLKAENVRDLAKHEAFRQPLNRVFLSRLGLSKPSFLNDLTDRIESDEHLKIALALLRSDHATLIGLVRHCTAAQLYPQIRSCVLKSRRKSLEQILGAEAFMTAMREGPVFFPSLPERSRFVQLEMFTDIGETSNIELADLFSPSNFTLHTLLWEGLATLIAFASKVDDDCAKLLELRFPIEHEVESSPKFESLTAAQAAELKKLLGYRGLEW